MRTRKLVGRAEVIEVSPKNRIFSVSMNGSDLYWMRDTFGDLEPGQEGDLFYISDTSYGFYEFKRVA